MEIKPRIPRTLLGRRKRLCDAGRQAGRIEAKQTTSGSSCWLRFEAGPESAIKSSLALDGFFSLSQQLPCQHLPMYSV